MTKKQILISLSCIFGLALLLFAVVTVFGGSETVRELENETGLHIDSADVQSSSDTHGGFFGDGETKAVFRADEEDIKTIKTGGLWRKMPMEGEIKVFFCGEKGYNDEGKFAELGFPSGDDCWYLFDDRVAKGQEELPFTQRYSYNYVVAVYEPSSGLIYYYNLDT